MPNSDVEKFLAFIDQDAWFEYSVSVFRSLNTACIVYTPIIPTRCLEDFSYVSIKTSLNELSHYNNTGYEQNVLSFFLNTKTNLILIPFTFVAMQY